MLKNTNIISTSIDKINIIIQRREKKEKGEWNFRQCNN